MHLAQFVHRFPPAIGGAESYAARLTSYLTGMGDYVSVWTSSAVELQEMWCPRKTGSSAANSHTLGRGQSVRRYAPLGFRGRRYVLKAMSLAPLRRWQCLTTPCNPISLAMWRNAGSCDEPLDAVHTTAFPYSFPIACGLRLARRRGVPFFVTPFLHLGNPDDPHDRTRKQYLRPHLVWLLRQADGIFVQTQSEFDHVRLQGVEAGRIHLQGLGVDPTECTGGHRYRARANWKVSEREVVFGHLANNSEEKGTCDLLRASERAWAAGHRFRIVLAGPEMPNFQSFFQHFPARDRVVRLGVLGEEQKRDFFAGIDAFALPSRTDSFGLVLLEAWANGKPCLVYRAGGPAELVRDGVDGFQVRSGDVAELSQRLAQLATDAALRETLGANGFARIPHEFRWVDKLQLVREVCFAKARATLAGRQSSPRSLRITDQFTGHEG